MKLTRLVTAAVLAAAFGITGLPGQAQNAQPAEFPPASFKGKQYVDSQGCVFIRAGIDGNVSWIPRMTRARKVVCGFTPSLGSRTASAPAARPAPVEKPVEITTNTTQPARPVAAAPAPAPTPTQRVVPRQAAQKIVRQTAPRRAAPAPKPVAVADPKPAPAPVAAAPAPRVAAASPCRGASALSQRYLRGDARAHVRCGPQAHRVMSPTSVAAQQAAPVHTARGPSVVSTPAGTVNGATRVVPRHVAENRVNTTNVTIPHGYKRVWQDGRLNPKRAEQTLAGRGQMLLIWTNTVPRRLINQSSGRDVTASVPLVYPYVDEATQRRELGEVRIVQRNGQTVKRIIRNPGVSQVTYSSRSVPEVQAAPAKPAQRVQPKAAATGPARYVQIGLFSTKAKAQSAARHLSGMGMGARMGTLRKGGKTYTVVQAGPFRSNAATDNALRRLRGVGYSGAVAR